MKKDSGFFPAVMKKALALCLCVLLLIGAVPFCAAEGAAASSDMAELVHALLLREAAKLKDPWQKAILESGVDQFAVDGNSVSFRLRGFDPKVKSLGAYATALDPSAWLASALKNASAFDLELSLEVDGGSVSAKALKDLLASVKKAAAAAKKDFGSRDFAAALKDRLFPVPVSGKVKDMSDLSSPDPQFSAWYEAHRDLLGNAPPEVAVAAFHMQKSQTLTVKDGPHALSMTCVGAPLSDLAGDSIREIKDAQAYLPLSARPAVNDPETELKTAFLAKAIPAAKKAREKTVITLDVDELAAGELPAGYRQYFASFNWAGTVDDLSSALKQLPDSAALTLPKPGVLSGQNKGTRVIFRISDQANPTYIIMRDAATDRIAVTAMALPGKSVTVKVPQGFYYIAWCSGPYWYGEQELFSTLGTYSKSEKVEILSSRYYHTFKLVKSNTGNTSIYGANPDDFR